MLLRLEPLYAIWQLDCTVENWANSLPIQSATAIYNFLSEQTLDITTLTELNVPADVIASWTEMAATQVGLPTNCPLSLDIRFRGAMGQPGASIDIRWLRPGTVVAARGVTVCGIWLSYQGAKYRINTPIYEVLSLVNKFNGLQEGKLDEQFRLWADIREKLGEKAVDQLTDEFLKNFRVITATTLSFSIKTDQLGNIQLAPVLLTENRNETDEVDHKVRALLEVDEVIFAQRLDQLREGAAAFPLNNGAYVVVDEPLQQALVAVRKLRMSPPEQRKRAAIYPEAVIREIMGVGEGEPIVFFETEKYAERVMDIGEWFAPVLPWIKIEPQQWGAPPAGGIRLDGKEIPLDVGTVNQAVTDIKLAIDAGKSTIEVSGERIAANPINYNVLKNLHEAMTKIGGISSPEEAVGSISSNVLIIQTNFNDPSFTRTTLGKRPGQIALPHGLRTTPKLHQEEGLTWLQMHWIYGSRGAMLCDDMGLGKTFQALAFCLWLRELMIEKKLSEKPLLIIAPVGLLCNWENEVTEHLFPPGLGEIVRVYGHHLNTIKRGSHIDGTASLDTTQLSRANVVFANYETVSNYQLSFGAVNFAAIILDEAQKIKSPKARMTHAVKALNTDFMLALTGTPVENRLADLWSIADAVQPGALSDLRNFSERFESENADVKLLREQIWQHEDNNKHVPKLLLRRLKSDKLEGLTEKVDHIIKLSMPQRQIDAYERALVMREVAGADGTLGMIHALRRASLHPALVDGGKGCSEFRVEDSARFIATIDILDKIAPSGDKVLIFLESLDLQSSDQLPLILKRRYGLSRLPMVINGQVTTTDRQSRVNLFQHEAGFDVMLLSPKAGGVGLTLTAANHVIHLSRWWNPAVEDQCSDRVYRIGQNKPVHIYYPLAVLPRAEDQSFDCQLQILMERKRKLARDLLVAPVFTKEDYTVLASNIMV